MTVVVKCKPTHKFSRATLWNVNVIEETVLDITFKHIDRPDSVFHRIDIVEFKVTIQS